MIKSYIENHIESQIQRLGQTVPSINSLELQNAIVLHTRPYQNSSLLVDFFTEKNGLIRCVAKGQRSKKNASQLAQFCLYQITFSGKSDLKTLQQLELPQRRFLLKKEALYSGFYINEVLLRVLFIKDTHAEVFQLSLNTFDALEKLNTLPDMTRQLEIVLRRFEFDLLKDIGYLVDMRHDCQTGAPIAENKRYYFDREMGFYEVMENIKHKQETQKVFSGTTIQTIAAQGFDKFVDMDDQYKNEAKIISRLMLAPYLGDKPLQSKNLFSKI